MYVGSELAVGSGVEPDERNRRDLLRRNEICTRFFSQEAQRLAEASREMSRRFLAGGRLLAFGRGPAATDAQHVSVEFVHPVIVGKRALPAVDLGADFTARIPLIVRPDDMVMGFAAAVPDLEVDQALALARERGALTFAFPGESADYAFAPPDADPFITQEVFEILYHLLWETVHVYFEHREQGHDVGASAFLYPFLGKQEQELDSVMIQVQQSMTQKVEEVNSMRAVAAESEAHVMTEAAAAINGRLDQGGTILTFGNGGSATDANDLALDCSVPPPGLKSLPAMSLSSEPAIITAITNDIGAEATFSRQVCAHAGHNDTAIAISTSGNSPNILSGLVEARKRGLLTVAFAGYDGGRVRTEKLADHVIVVHSDYIPRIQEVQASIYHVLLRRIAEMQSEE
ncbi:MAG: SIS domain-containing protein [Chloroflexota bacterium]